MFFWKKIKVGENLNKPATETKDNSEKPSEDAAENKLSTTLSHQDSNDEKPSVAESEKKSSKTLKESVDSIIYKILTRRRKKRSNPKKKKEEEADIGEVKWRGPREQQSEVPMQRKRHSVRN